MYIHIIIQTCSYQCNIQLYNTHVYTHIICISFTFMFVRTCTYVCMYNNRVMFVFGVYNELQKQLCYNAPRELHSEMA